MNTLHKLSWSTQLIVDGRLANRLITAANRACRGITEQALAILASATGVCDENFDYNIGDYGVEYLDGSSRGLSIMLDLPGELACAIEERADERAIPFSEEAVLLLEKALPRI